MSHCIPVALTIAGSDCSAGAGIQADLKTFQHFQVHGLTAITCVVAETAHVVQTIHPIPVAIVCDQIRLLIDAFPIAAVKTGMLFSAAHVKAVAGILHAHRSLQLVVDPVMMASTGDELLESDALAAYCDDLLPLARVITPNLPEAEVLLGERIADVPALVSAAHRLSEQFGTAVLVKGGHLSGPECLDVLVERGNLYRFTAKRIALVGSHGTGCTLSAAMTAALAHGASLPQAVEQAKHFLGQALRQSFVFPSPGGGTVPALNQGTHLEIPLSKNDA